MDLERFVAAQVGTYDAALAWRRLAPTWRTTCWALGCSSAAGPLVHWFGGEPDTRTVGLLG